MAAVDDPSKTLRPSPAVRKTSQILLIEDDPIVARMLSRTLVNAGYTVEHVTTGTAGLDLALRTSYDAVLLDLGLPEMGGLEVLNVLRRYDNQIPVVLLTGSPTFESAQTAMEFGASRYITKPVEPDILLRSVEAARLGRALRRSGPPPRIGVSELSEIITGLHLVIQPIMGQLGTQTFAHEALMRAEKSRGPISPLDIIAACEAYRMTNQLGRVVRARAAEVLGRLSPTSILFVNLHPLDLLDDELLSDANPLAPVAGRVVLELTERAALDSIAGVDQRLAKLRGRGFRFAIDDLGAGASGLARVAQVVPEFIKIDMSLIRDIHLDAVRARLVKALVNAGREMQVSVVAEGIERVEEFLAVGDLGVDYFQGYFFGRPAPLT